MLIRRERADDAAAIAAVHRSAFAPHYATAIDPAGTESSGDRDSADPPEVGLVDRLRSDEGWIPTLSLVAIEHDSVVGHLCLTRATVGPFPVLALGPIGVLADHQGAGVGSALMHAALGAADALDEPLVGLLGSLEFYPTSASSPPLASASPPTSPLG